MRGALAALLLAAAPASRAGPPDGAEPSPRAASVRLDLPPGEDPRVAVELVDLRAGEPVTPRRLRRSALRLFQTGRCRNVVIRAAAAPAPAGAPEPWLDLTVACLPLRRLAGVEVALDGPSPLDGAALAAATGLEAGQAVDDDDLAAAGDRVRAALRRLGHRAAEASVALEPAPGAAGRVRASLRVRAGPLSRVASVTLPGAGDLEPSLLARLSTRPGAPLLEGRLDEDVRTLRVALAEAGHRRARVGAPALAAGPEGVRVAIPVAPGPRIELRILGARGFEEEALLAQLALPEDAPLDPPAIDAAADRLRAFYRARGHALARVDVEERTVRGSRWILFHVDAGPYLGLRHVRFPGATARGEGWLREELRRILDEEAPPADEGGAAGTARAITAAFPGARTRDVTAPALPPSRVLDEVALDRAIARLLDDERADGWLEAASAGWSAELDTRAGVADLTIRLADGVRTLVDAIAWEGNARVPLSELARQSRLAPGQPLVADQVEETRTAILRLYLARGFLFARVEAREEVDAARHRATVRFLVAEGPQVRIGRIVVTGAVRTRDDVIRRAIEVHEGEVYDPEAVSRTQAALLGLGVFRSVGLRLQEPERPEPVKDLVVELAERPWLTVAPGAGFSIADGPRAFLDVGEPNLLGRALELDGTAKVNYPLTLFRPDLVGVPPDGRWEGRADVGLRAPHLDPLPAASRLDVIAERLRRPAYQMSDVSTILSADVPITARISLSLQYELGVYDLLKSGEEAFLTQIDIERLRFDAGITTLQAFRPVVTLDFRDSPTNPRLGWFATGFAELDHSLGTGGTRILGVIPGSDIHTDMVKVQGTISGYVPLDPTLVLAVSLRGGRVIPLDPASRTIIPRRFFLGGADSMRGYEEEEMIPADVRPLYAAEGNHCASSLSGVGCTSRGQATAAGVMPVSEGGEAFVLAKGELRQSLGGSLQLGLFVDLGNLWLNPDAFDVLALRPNAGAGLRFVTPVGPAALDLGFNLDPDRRVNERAYGVHFTIGLF